MNIKRELNLIHLFFLNRSLLIKLGIDKNEKERILAEIFSNKLMQKSLQHFVFEFQNLLKKFNNKFTWNAFLELNLINQNKNLAKKIIKILMESNLVKNKNSIYFGYLDFKFNDFFTKDLNYYKNISTFLEAKKLINPNYVSILEYYLLNQSITDLENDVILSKNICNFFNKIEINCFENKFLDYLNAFIPPKDFWNPSQLFNNHSIGYLKMKINSNLLNRKRSDINLDQFKKMFGNSFNKLIKKI
ncbi:hypothetical protein [Mycoplasmoides alvi]|uniref:hypothetical protein n=1 Tax=Mycoplasmoides alvi TaxID=78580 RepID=UPI0012ECA34B|nr:hypothetical protein [Mycoplasmoides alvi]